MPRAKKHKEKFKLRLLTFEEYDYLSTLLNDRQILPEGNELIEVIASLRDACTEAEEILPPKQKARRKRVDRNDNDVPKAGRSTSAGLQRPNSTKPRKQRTVPKAKKRRK